MQSGLKQQSTINDGASFSNDVDLSTGGKYIINAFIFVIKYAVRG